MAFEPGAPLQPTAPQRKRVPLGGSRRRLSFERRLRVSLYLMGLPVLILCLILCRVYEASWPAVLVWVTVILAGWALGISLLLEQIVRPLQTLANVVAALREDDYSFRARGARRNDAVGDLALEVNALAGMLQAQRAGALEAIALAERVMEAMQSPVLAFDPTGRLHLMNPAGERIFGLHVATALGKSASELKLDYLLATSDGELVSPGAQTGQQIGRWVVKRTSFRLRGVRHVLLMLSDVSAALREEERQAWERLIRVLGHEINNSLAPIKSIAGSLRGRLAPAEVGSDLERGLTVIEDRAESLNRFLQAYRQLMGLPVPKLAPISLAVLVERVLHLETRLRVEMLDSKDQTVYVDADQLQQALINLVRNAAEAALHQDTPDDEVPSVQMGWKIVGDEVVIFILDNGPGLSNESNLFVPFYTTKPGGTGIGLVLAQQIAEAHRGNVRLINRTEGLGCVAELRLPMGISDQR